MLAAANQHVRLDTDLTQLPDRMLSRLGFELCGSLQIGHQRQMDKQAVLFSGFHRKLANGFKERQALDIADRTADLGDYHVDIALAQLANDALDFVGDMGNDLDGLA